MGDIGGMGWNNSEVGPGIDLGVSVVLHESPEFSLRVHQVHVHKNSISLHLDGRGRDFGSGSSTIRERREQIGVSVRFSDGRSARLDDSAGIKTGRGPLVTWGEGTWRAGGAQGIGDYDLVLRVWPLPPPGPLVLSVTWPEIGLAEAEVAIDGERAERLGRALRSGDEAEVLSPPLEPVADFEDVVVPLLVGMDVHTARSVAQRNGLYLEHPDPDGPPLSSGVVVAQHPQAGDTVPRFTPIRAWVHDEGEQPPFLFGPDDPGGGGPPGGVREPRMPKPTSGEGLAEATP